MKKESLKTAALVLLVFCSIILTINKWFSEKLWPDGYNFFSNLTSYFSFGEKPVEKTYYLSKENISNPSKKSESSKKFEKMSYIIIPPYINVISIFFKIFALSISLFGCGTTMLLSLTPPVIICASL